MGNDIEKARKKRGILERLKLRASWTPVVWEDVVRESDSDCKECGGSGLVHRDEDALCACAEQNFQRRRGHQVEMRKGDCVWKPGYPRG